MLAVGATPPVLAHARAAVAARAAAVAPARAHGRALTGLSDEERLASAHAGHDAAARAVAIAVLFARAVRARGAAPAALARAGPAGGVTCAVRAAPLPRHAKRLGHRRVGRPRECGAQRDTRVVAACAPAAARAAELRARGAGAAGDAGARARGRAEAGA